MSGSVELAAVVVTAVATAVLAFVTYRAVKGADRTARAADRTARAAERTLALSTRAVLVPAHGDDPSQRVVFHEGHRLHPEVKGGKAVFEVEDAGKGIYRVYMAIALRNVGLGLAILYGWHLSCGLLLPETRPEECHEFIAQWRSLYVPPGGVGFWQALATEEKEAPQYHPEVVKFVRDALNKDKGLTVDLLYGDEEGGQGRIARFHLRPLSEAAVSKSERSCEVARSWGIDTLEGSWPKQQGKLRLRTDQAETVTSVC